MIRRTPRQVRLSVALLVVFCRAAAAQSTDLPGEPQAAQALELPPDYAGPAVPRPPNTLSRDSVGRATIRAVPLVAPLRVDGNLDEAIYGEHLPITDFLQTEPSEGSPATEKTEVWILFDRDNVYVSVRCWESHPERMIVNDMRRDGINLGRQENVAFYFDTFYDGRNGFVFNVNPLGGRADGQTSNERQYNIDWNPVWRAEVRRFEGGWTVEAEIPFKSLRYQPGQSQIWGFNMRRLNRWKNEMSYITQIPNSLGSRGLYQGSLAATLVGLIAPPGSRNLEIKPYAISSLRSDAGATPAVSNDLGGDIGVDVKYGVTQNLTADFTYNTDFAQVEADEQQINLTRFSLFYPEKRDFFLENQGTFVFGGAAVSSDAAASSDTPILFYSRRIGLNNGRSVPIDAGGRLTGRIGKYSLGALGIQTEGQPTGPDTTAFSVFRLKRDILRRSSHRRHCDVALGGAERPRRQPRRRRGRHVRVLRQPVHQYLLGPDAARRDARATRTATEDRSSTPAIATASPQSTCLSATTSIPKSASFAETTCERVMASCGSAPVRTTAGSFAATRGSAPWTTWRIPPAASRRATSTGSSPWSSRTATGSQSGERSCTKRCRRRFRSRPGVTLPVGEYDYGTTRVQYLLGLQHKVSGTLTAEHGSFYDGTRTGISFVRTRAEINTHLSVEPTVSINRVELPQGSFTTRLAGARIIFAATPSMFVSALLQYNSDADVMSSNVRLRWEYQPGSELFVVYTEQLDTAGVQFQDRTNRVFVVKINRLFRF